MMTPPPLSGLNRDESRFLTLLAPWLARCCPVRVGPPLGMCSYLPPTTPMHTLTAILSQPIAKAEIADSVHRALREARNLVYALSECVYTHWASCVSANGFVCIRKVFRVYTDVVRVYANGFVRIRTVFRVYTNVVPVYTH